MRLNAKTVLLAIYCLFSIPLLANAENEYGYRHEHQHDYEYKQKLILVQGKKSSVMNGEQTPAFNFNKKKVLPYYF